MGQKVKVILLHDRRQIYVTTLVSAGVLQARRGAGIRRIVDKSRPTYRYAISLLMGYHRLVGLDFVVMARPLRCHVLPLLTNNLYNISTREWTV